MAIPDKPGRTVRRARRLRREMSSAEVILWQVLRRAPAGVRFRRQHPAGRYVLDFYCAAVRLAIEVDGAFHDRGNAPACDAERNVWLAGYGITTMRIAARDIYSDLDAVVAGILAAVGAHLPLHHPALPDGPPPQALLGED